MKRRIEAGSVRHHDLANMTQEERAASIGEGLSGEPLMHSRVRFLVNIGKGSDPWGWDWARKGDEGAIVEIIPSPDPNAPARGYVVEIVTPIAGAEFPACRIVCCAAKDVEVIWTPDNA